MTADRDIEPRVARRSEALAARFREIAATVRDLPFYNERLAVEAIDFRPFGDGILGVLVTPWFMNLMLLPEPQGITVDWNRVGQKRLVQLPRGPREFRYAGDEVLGEYWSHSLHSPMSAFNDPAQARHAARAALAALLAPEAAAAGAPQRPDRRAFLSARLPGSA
jgi:[NiFe] hydrogenase assembly HybE family chaperone